MKYGGFFYKFIVRLQWLFILIFVGLIGFYVGTAFVWAILGAIIDPTIYLVYTSSAGTFLTIITT
jgi:hypothetical protein